MIKYIYNSEVNDLIKLKDVSKIYYNNGVVGTGFSNISVEFKIGEFVVIVGESGSGKSTLLNVISGLDTYEEGEMYINGEETSHYVEQDFEEYRRKYVANIFQSFNLVNSYTVKQNVELVLLINGYDSKTIKNRVSEILKNVGLWELRNKKVTKLSGGQKQRVAIARALAKETPIIIADEPTGNLDSESAKQIFELLHNMSKDKLVVVVTHNLEQVEKYATRIVRMHDGHIIEDKKIKKIEEVKPQTATHKEMSFTSKYFLALRNTFNIIPRFLIILGVFLAVSITILGEYADINNSDYQDAVLGASSIFIDNSPERIIINKPDKKIITDDDIKELEAMEHIKRVVTKDWLLDQYVHFSNDERFLERATIGIIDDYDGDLSKGTKPVKDGEILLVGNKDSIDFLYIDDWFNKRGTIEIPMPSNTNGFLDNPLIDAVITGYTYDNSLSTSYLKFYVTENTFKEIQAFFTALSSKILLDFGDDNKFEEMIRLTQIVLSKDVPKSTIYISNNRANYIDQNFFRDDITLIQNSFYGTNSKKVNVLRKELDDPSVMAMINPYDIYDLLPTENYQLSLYADDYKRVDELVNKLRDMGYNVYPVKDTNTLPSAIVKLYDFINYISIGFIILGLFLVSNFIISLVLKSKTTYYAVVRILGGNIKLNKNLISLELFNCMNIAFILTIILTFLNLYKVIDIEALNNAIRFLKPIHFVAVYIVLIIFSQLLSRRYSKKIFKDSMITTYNGEI